MRKLFLAMMAVLAAAVVQPVHAADPVVVTVTGNVAAPNRGAMDPFEDPVFGHLDVKFDKGFTFTLPDLRALPQRSVTVRYKDWPREVTATGPGIAEVLKAAQATGKKVLVQAADGYAPEFTFEDIAKDKMILALEADGKPLALGSRGPLWLLGPPDSFSGQEDEEGFAYAVIRIDVQ